MRLQYLDSERAVASVRHRWVNQNPFRSLFWAVQGMAAELSTGALVMDKIRRSGRDVAMLVVSNKSTFSKKATGKITFSCEDGKKMDDALDKAIQSGEGQTIWMKSTGTNEEGVCVSTFEFEWTIRLRPAG